MHCRPSGNYSQLGDHLDSYPDATSEPLASTIQSGTCAMVKSRYIGDGHPTFNRNPYNGYINPYYWVDDHPLLYGNNGSLDPSTHEPNSINILIVMFFLARCCLGKSINIPLLRMVMWNVYGYFHCMYHWYHMVFIYPQ